ncbi:papain-like cysteine protease family protein [Pseudogulbenkiania ferrooxidans]|uniref:papain-like cysteine protease family protein n=1 Tax=Pseudogulbenkiania ferrooxidans TaxID=549169 RepID=UPI0009DBE0AE|nr:papain-like cysteine protease family protein [Pseudogulbenkiania ferrooxidans]
MNRRAFLTFFSTGLASVPLLSYARLSCGPFVPPGVQQCEAGIDSSVAAITAAAVGGQHLSEWCWAACIETVLTYYGHRVPQERIVRDTWGSIVNLPGQPGQILADLNRDWTDENGEEFSVSGDAYSANAITAAQDLAQDMPLIIGTMGHAMVLTSLVYVRDSFGRGNVNAAIVRDPWPGRGRRVLTPQEWFRINFAVRIRVL